MASPAMRRSDRVSLTLLLEASGKDSYGKEFKEPCADAADQSRRRGDRARPGAEAPSSRFICGGKRRSESHRAGDVRVVGQFGRQKDGYLYGVEILDAEQ